MKGREGKSICLKCLMLDPLLTNYHHDYKVSIGEDEDLEMNSADDG